MSVGAQALRLESVGMSGGRLSGLRPGWRLLRPMTSPGYVGLLCMGPDQPVLYFEQGEIAYVWTKASSEAKPRWHGPGHVLGQVGARVWVALVASVYRCAPEQLRGPSVEQLHLLRMLPAELRRCRNTVRERGAGNVVELNQRVVPPPEEQLSEPVDAALMRVNRVITKVARLPMQMWEVIREQESQWRWKICLLHMMEVALMARWR